MNVYVRYIKNSGFVRYLLQRDDGRFWTPQGTWKRNRRRAVLFANLSDCHKEYFKITDITSDGLFRHFAARFEIFVNGDSEFTVDELKDWLVRHVRFTVTTEDGPVDGCKTQVYARFGTVKETNQER